jgi:hypothetical protein
VSLDQGGSWFNLNPAGLDGTPVMKIVTNPLRGSHEAYVVTPMVAGFADLLNKVASAGFGPWQVGQGQSVFGKTFAPFGLAEGRDFMEYDLVYLQGDYLFWGARNIDGRGFDTEQNRPTNLQIPLRRKG